MGYKCEIYHQEAQPVLSIRKRTSVENLPQILGEAYTSIAQYLEELGQQPSGAPFAAYHNMDMQNLDVEIGFLVSQPFAGNQEIQSTEMPSGYYATVFHKGPYPELANAYSALTDFIKMHGRTPTGVAYEFYLNSPMDVPQQELKTQIAFPLQSIT